MVPVTWSNRQHGVSKLKLNEMGSRYLFIVLYVWLEHHLSRGDYRRKDASSELPSPNGATELNSRTGTGSART